MNILARFVSIAYWIKTLGAGGGGRQGKEIITKALITEASESAERRYNPSVPMLASIYSS